MNTYLVVCSRLLQAIILLSCHSIKAIMTISQGIYDKMAKVLGNFKGKKAVILANFNFKIAL